MQPPAFIRKCFIQDLLAPAARSGAMAYFSGFESLQEKTLTGLNQNMNLLPPTRKFKE